MELHERIARFENMAQADPDNEMAHFSLGQALIEAGQHAQAAQALLRCVELNSAMTKAHQLAGEALRDAGQNEQAVEILTKGYIEATKRGDRMPAQAMQQALEELGAPTPVVEVEHEPATPTHDGAAPVGDFVCKRTGMPGTRLPMAPFNGAVGAWIQENISAETWRAWLAQGTKVINELRLDLSRDEDNATYDRCMHEFLGISEELAAQLTDGQTTAETDA